MAILLDEVRVHRRAGKPAPSLREVCLLGVSREWEQGDRAVFAGRSYRVAATSGRSLPEDDPRRYIHLIASS